MFDLMIAPTKRCPAFVCFLTLILLSIPSSPLADQFKVTRVYDGDTIRVETSEHVLYIMLVGIDSPEISCQNNKQGQPFGHKAKTFLSDMILRRMIEVQGYGAAPYPNNNIIGVIYLDGKNINLEMVRVGLAEVYRGKIPTDLDISLFLEAEKEAREARRGMWALGKKYLSPREWREMHRDANISMPARDSK